MKNKYPFNESYFENIDTEHKAYWLGFLYADGCVIEMKTKNITEPHIVQLCLGEEDIDTIEEFKKDVECKKPTYVAYHNNPVSAPTKYCRIQLSSKKMANDLCKHGCVPRKSLILTFPTTVPNNLINHFIRGYFDGDGSVYFSERYQNRKDRKNPTLQRSFRASFQGTSDFLNAVKENLINYGISVGCVRKGHGNISCFEISSRDSMAMFYHYLYDEATVYLERKYQKFIDTFNYLNMAY